MFLRAQRGRLGVPGEIDDGGICRAWESIVNPSRESVHRKRESAMSLLKPRQSAHRPATFGSMQRTPTKGRTSDRAIVHLLRLHVAEIAFEPMRLPAFSQKGTSRFSACRQNSWSAIKDEYGSLGFPFTADRISGKNLRLAKGLTGKNKVKS